MAPPPPPQQQPQATGGRPRPARPLPLRPRPLVLRRKRGQRRLRPGRHRQAGKARSNAMTPRSTAKKGASARRCGNKSRSSAAEPPASHVARVSRTGEPSSASYSHSCCALKSAPRQAPGSMLRWRTSRPKSSLERLPAPRLASRSSRTQPSCCSAREARAPAAALPRARGGSPRQHGAGARNKSGAESESSQGRPRPSTSTRGQASSEVTALPALQPSSSRSRGSTRPTRAPSSAAARRLASSARGSAAGPAAGTKLTSAPAVPSAASARSPSSAMLTCAKGLCCGLPSLSSAPCMEEVTLCESLSVGLDRCPQGGKRVHKRFPLRSERRRQGLCARLALR